MKEEITNKEEIKMKKDKVKIEELVKKYAKKYVKKLLSGDFEVVDFGEHTADVKVEGDMAVIWMANEDHHTDFFDSGDGFPRILAYYGSIPDKSRAKIRENIKEKISIIEGNNGKRRAIEQTQMSNDLFFRFKGVYKDVKFTGYNDNDWWTKYKPSEVKEDENITWEIDWDNMQAIYKIHRR